MIDSNLNCYRSASQPEQRDYYYQGECDQDCIQKIGRSVLWSSFARFCIDLLFAYLDTFLVEVFFATFDLPDKLHEL